MRMRVQAMLMYLVLSLFLSLYLDTALGQEVGVSASAPSAVLAHTLYVIDFTAMDQGGRGVLLPRLRAGVRARKAQDSALALTQALVRALRSAGWQAVYLPPGAPTPNDGWIVRGVLYVEDDQGHLLSMLSDPIGPQTPNTEVTIGLADAALDPSTPFAVLGRSDALRGLGTNASWNPYIVAAKFVLHSAESASSVDALAAHIVGDMQANRNALEQQDQARRQPGR